MLAWPCVKFSILKLLFVDIFPWLPFQEQVGHIGTMSSGHNGTLSQCAPLYDNDIDSIFWHFISESFFISPEYYFDSIVSSSFYRLAATHSLFAPCSKSILTSHFAFVLLYEHIVPMCPIPHPNVPQVWGTLGQMRFIFQKVLTPTMFAQQCTSWRITRATC